MKERATTTRGALTLHEVAIVRWDGGSIPNRGQLEGGRLRDFDCVTRRIFREVVREWEARWGEKVWLGMARVMWGIARFDAWATARSAGWVR